MAAEQYVIAMTGMGDTEETLLRLAEALEKIDVTCESFPAKEMTCPVVPMIQKSMGEALCAESVEVSLDVAVGRVAAEHLWAYPPGIPVVVAGEEITEETVAYLSEKQKHGVELHRKSGTCKDELVIYVIKE